MLVEGKGFVAPAPQDERLSKGTLAALEMEAKRRSEYRRYAQRADRWGVGFDPNAILRGLAGEQAFAQFVNRRLRTSLSVDCRLIRNGDGGRDFEAFGESIQVKCRGRRFGKNLIRVIDDKGRLRPMGFGVCCFALWQDNALSRSRVSLLGWVSADDARQYGRRVKSTRGDHHNIEISDEMLRPMSQLIERLALRSGL